MTDNKIIIKNISNIVTEEDCALLAGKFGIIYKLKMMNMMDTKECEVIYTKNESAKDAIESLNGRVIDEKEIVVEMKPNYMGYGTYGTYGSYGDGYGDYDKRDYGFKPLESPTYLPVSEEQYQDYGAYVPNQSPNYGPGDAYGVDDYCTYPYRPRSPDYRPRSPDYRPRSPDYRPRSPDYDPRSPDYDPRSPDYDPRSPAEYRPLPPDPNEEYYSEPYRPGTPDYGPGAVSDVDTKFKLQHKNNSPQNPEISKLEGSSQIFANSDMTGIAENLEDDTLLESANKQSELLKKKTKNQDKENQGEEELEVQNLERQNLERQNLERQNLKSQNTNDSLILQAETSDENKDMKGGNIDLDVLDLSEFDINDL